MSVQIFHSIATEVLNNRLNSKLTPRQICRFIHLYGSAKTLFPYVFNQCFARLLLTSDHEKSELNWIVNRMCGRVRGSDGNWHSSPLPKSEPSLDFQIGYWDSQIFVGSKFALTCRGDAEHMESQFYSRLLNDQLTMTPQMTLDVHPTIELKSICYPLFAMRQFESTIEAEQPTDAMREPSFLRHPCTASPKFSKVIIQMLEGLNSVSYHDELILRPIGQLLVGSSLRPSKPRSRKFDHQSSHSSNQEVIRQTGLELLAEWSRTDILIACTAFMSSGIRVPSAAIMALGEKIFPHLQFLKGSELGRLIEDIACSCRGQDL